MANEKYDNLTVMMSAGKLHWDSDQINAVLFTSATFVPTQKDLTEVGAPRLGVVPVPGRSIGEDGSFLGWPISFEAVEKDIPLQVALVRDDGVNNDLLVWYDEDDAGEEYRLKNHGTFILRPTVVPQAVPPILGCWVAF